MNSIRQRLTWPIVGGLTFLIIVSGCTVFLLARHYLQSHFDAALAIKARAISALVEQEVDQTFHTEFSDQDIPEFLSKESPHYYQVWLETGEVLGRSGNLSDDLPRLKSPAGTTEVEDFILPNGHQARAVAISFYPLLEVNETRRDAPIDIRKLATVVVARDRSELDQTLWTLLALMIGAAVILPALCAGIVISTVKKSLQPVNTLSSSLQKITSLASVVPFSEARMPTELRPIVRQLNSLMERLQASFERERRFTMNASHELRTPLAEARAALEVALKWQNDPALMISQCQTALESMTNMQGLISALLALARADNHTLSQIEKEPVNLLEITSQAWSLSELEATRRGLSLQIQDADGIEPVVTIPSLIHSILSNLIQNSVAYASANSIIHIDFSSPTANSQGTLSIQNETSDDLTKEDLENLFEPLWRKEASRTLEGQGPGEEYIHSGIGLPLVRTFCRILGATIEAHQPAPRVLQMIIIFPERTEVPPSVH